MWCRHAWMPQIAPIPEPMASSLSCDLETTVFIAFRPEKPLEIKKKRWKIKEKNRRRSSCS